MFYCVGEVLFGVFSPRCAAASHAHVARARSAGRWRGEFLHAVFSREESRVLVKDGVSIGGIRPELLFGMMVVNNVFEQLGEQLVITSVCEGVHGSWSYHPAGLAFDLRLPVDEDKDMVGAVLRDALGSEFDVVVESDHIHVEYEVRRIHR